MIARNIEPNVVGKLEKFLVRKDLEVSFAVILISI